MQNVKREAVSTTGKLHVSRFAFHITGLTLALLAKPGCFASSIAEEVQPRTADMRMAEHFDLFHTG
jgi:hypothetical protein